MAITKEKKKELVAQYVEAATASRGMIITEFRGLSTPELGRLRAAVRGASGSYSVVKVTLFKIALERAGIPVPEDMLIGPVAVGYCHQELPAVAKALKDYGKDHEKLVIKGGIMGDRFLSLAEVETIADLPPLEVIRSQLMGLVNGPARNLAGVVAGGVRQVVNVFNAYADSDRQKAGADA